MDQAILVPDVHLLVTDAVQVDACDYGGPGLPPGRAAKPTGADSEVAANPPRLRRRA
ncbi:hypothetical protein [Amycolatopsis sp. cmx-4-68]|uniref:hypothetical protein n=1 Tax=Amycolatopsis sp. cmx-4-68 TaxID=2790938 RepID=UPI003978F10A